MLLTLLDELDESDKDFFGDPSLLVVDDVVNGEDDCNLSVLLSDESDGWDIGIFCIFLFSLISDILDEKGEYSLKNSSLSVVDSDFLFVLLSNESDDWELGISLLTF